MPRPGRGEWSPRKSDLFSLPGNLTRHATAPVSALSWALAAEVVPQGTEKKGRSGKRAPDVTVSVTAQ